MTLRDLTILYDGEEQTLRIIKQVAPHWRELARVFNFDERLIAESHSTGVDFSSNCCYDVLRKWFQMGAPGYPLTWNGLIRALRDVELDEVVANVQAALECV